MSYCRDVSELFLAIRIKELAIPLKFCFVQYPHPPKTEQTPCHQQDLPLAQSPPLRWPETREAGASADSSKSTEPPHWEAAKPTRSQQPHASTAEHHTQSAQTASPGQLLDLESALRLVSGPHHRQPRRDDEGRASQQARQKAPSPLRKARRGSSTTTAMARTAISLGDDPPSQAGQSTTKQHQGCRPGGADAVSREDEVAMPPAPKAIAVITPTDRRIVRNRSE